jgi:hypothetical protein
MRTISVATALATALSLPAPPASASHEHVFCRMVGASPGVAMGQYTYESVLSGYVLGSPGEVVAVRCVVRVNGAVTGATDWATGTTAAVSAGRVSFVRTLTQQLHYCAQYTLASEGSREVCWDTQTLQVPPQELVDLMDELKDRAFDPAICAVLESLIGNYEFIVVQRGAADSNGHAGPDAYLKFPNGLVIPVYDCPGPG